ncbi:MAG: HypC/HybG/HupF family hydrogenase formation chaperone [Candidatus Obscuribacterales bacterium]|nr:HypC/HybG/HupF family hydrogenase formation chaperone [Candidatus Obscuribacterales bacterium]
MCLAIPGQVEEIFLENSLTMAKVNFGGIRRSVCLDYTPEAKQGDYVLVHVGFSISLIDEEEAKRTLAELSAEDIDEINQS